LLGTKAAEEADIKSHLNNIANMTLQAAKQTAEVQLERIADVPVYFADAIVRRAESLQLTTDAKAPTAWLSAAVAEKLGISDGAQVKVIQGSGEAVLPAAIDAKLPGNVVRVSAAHVSTIGLGGMFGAISVEKV
jgi:NADH-quinone oxidoreductase subunit G